MSLRLFLFLSIFLFLISCNNDHSKSIDYSHLSSTEKDSLANQYHQISNYFLQPSEMYRIYKDSALMVQPNNVDIRQRLSYSYKKVGEHIKGMEELNKATEIDVANGKVDVIQYRAWTLLYYYRDYKGAVRDVDLIEKMTNNPYNSCWGEPCGFIKGQALYKLGKYKEAINTLIKVNLEEEKLGFTVSDNFFNFFYIGRCYAEMKNYNKAIENFNKSLVSNEKFPEAYYQLGLAYKSLQNKEKAKEYFGLANKFIRYNLDEPYIERFDEVFPYMIKKELSEYRLDD